MAWEEPREAGQVGSTRGRAEGRQPGGPALAPGQPPDPPPRPARRPPRPRAHPASRRAPRPCPPRTRPPPSSPFWRWPGAPPPAAPPPPAGKGATVGVALESMVIGSAVVPSAPRHAASMPRLLAGHQTNPATHLPLPLLLPLLLPQQRRLRLRLALVCAGGAGHIWGKRYAAATANLFQRKPHRRWAGGGPRPRPACVVQLPAAARPAARPLTGTPLAPGSPRVACTSSCHLAGSRWQSSSRASRSRTPTRHCSSSVLRRAGGGGGAGRRARGE